LDPQTFWRLKGLIASLKPDIVHTWMLAANAYGISAAAWCKVPGLIASQRCVDPWKSRGQLAVDRWIAKRSRRVVVNSECVRRFYEHHGLPANKIAVIPNAVSPAEPSPVGRKELLEELGLPAGARLIGLIGRLWPQKRVKDAIWATDLLKVVRDDVHLLIIGNGPLRDRLLQYRDQVRIRDKVHFLGQRTDVARLLPHFDLLFSTSGYEGQSNTILEAMAAGVPVVATDIPGTRDLIEHEVNGFLVPVGNRAEFARHANKLLEDAELAGRLGEAGQRRAATDFGVAQMIERYTALYEDVLA
ncbi:MAG: glycosyltransferase, partial [Patescibacteria group bacterium]|nr:glycosyltransferase [Patescibacteria group bacterium]